VAGQIHRAGTLAQGRTAAGGIGLLGSKRPVGLGLRERRVTFLSQHDCDEIKTGWGHVEVEKLLGTPSRREAGEFMSTHVWIDLEGNTIRVDFLGGKVFSTTFRQGSFSVIDRFRSQFRGRRP
jgi:hypothetical protein